MPAGREYIQDFGAPVLALRIVRFRYAAIVESTAKSHLDVAALLSPDVVVLGAGPVPDSWTGYAGCQMFQS